MDKDNSKNLKDTEVNLIKDTTFASSSLAISRPRADVFFTKTDKLITALYMVTDIMDKEEPLRQKLRIRGTEIISDIRSARPEVTEKISEVVSFLNIAGAMNFISEMNSGILIKEFAELSKSLQEITKGNWLEDFLKTSETNKDMDGNYQGQDNFYKGHTRLGVQKGSTLMQALSAKTQSMGNNRLKPSSDKLGGKQSLDILKKERRAEILRIIKTNGGSATIKDIMQNMNLGADRPSFSEKTLQRELASLIKDGVLDKSGKKRWSTYVLR